MFAFVPHSWAGSALHIAESVVVNRGVGVGAAIFVVAAARYIRTGYPRPDEPDRWIAFLFVGLAAFAAVAVAVPVLRDGGRATFEVHEYVRANLTEATGLPPSFEPRIPYPVAEERINRSITTAGQVADVTRVADQWCALIVVDQRLLARSVDRVVCVADDGTITSADFDVPIPFTGDGSYRDSNLHETIAERHGITLRTQHYEYGYIDDDGAPWLVAPVAKTDAVRTGFVARTVETPAGVVVFAKDGTSKYRPSVKAGEIPGPVVSAEAAQAVRETVNTLNGYLAFRRPSRSDSSLSVSNEGDNPTEFVMTTVEGRTVYVSLLSPFGNGRTVTAVLVVDADTVTAGQFPSATLYRLDEPLPAPATVEERVTSLYDIRWGDERGQFSLFEPNVGESGQIVVSAGTTRGETFRFVVSGTPERQTVCVFAAVSGKELRCDGPDVTGPVRIPTTDTAEIGGSGEASPDGATDPVLSEVSDQDLLDEIQRRLGN